MSDGFAVAHTGADMRIARRIWARDGVYFAQVSRDVVILDVSADSYAALPGAAELLEVGVDGGLAIADPDFAEELVQAGFAQTTQPDVPRAPLIRANSQEALSGPSEFVPAAVTATRLLVSTFIFQGKSLSQLVKLAETPTADHAPVDQARLEAALKSYRRALPWVPFEKECLQRGFLLKRLLLAHDIHAQWIFGVRTWPFAAHCWVQVHDTVVGDSLERVSNYTPIMAA